MKMTDDELREAHDDLDSDRAAELKTFKARTVQHKTYLATYKEAKQALPRRPKDEESSAEVTA